MTRHIDRVFVRLPNWVGDIMMALPALRALRASCPDAQVIAMARPDHVPFAQRIVWLDEVTEASPRGGLGRGRALWRMAKMVRARAPDAAVLFAPSFEAALGVWLSGVSVRIGHDTDHRGWLLTDRVGVRTGHRSDGLVDLVARLAGNLAAPEESLASGYVCAAREREWVDRLFERLGVDPTTPPIFVNPSSAKVPRAWPSDRFRELANELLDVRRAPIIVHGRPPFDPGPSWPDRPGIDIVSNASLVQLAALLERCAAYVGNDSGPMHIAAAMGVPTVGIYGPSSPAHTSPRGSRHVSVTASFDCAPCGERFFKDCPSPPTQDGRPPCLNAIPVEDVVSAVRRATDDYGR